MSLAFSPLMPVFAAICTFTALILTGNTITVTQVTSFCSTFYTCITRVVCITCNFAVRKQAVAGNN